MGFKKRLARLLADWLRDELRDEIALTSETSTWQLGDEGMVLVAKETTSYGYIDGQRTAFHERRTETPNGPMLEFDYYPAIEDK